MTTPATDGSAQQGRRHALVPILAYCGASILMTTVNKLCMSQFKLHVGFLMLAVQSVCCVLFLWLFGSFGAVKYQALTVENAQKWFRVSLAMALMLYTSVKSLQYLSVPLFTIFKNLTIILVAYGERIMFRNKVTSLMLASFCLMVLSSVIGGWNDISFSVDGYVWMALNCMASAMYVLFMRGVIKSMGFKDFDTVYYNNAMTAPLFLALSALTEDWPSFTQYYFYDKDNVGEMHSLAGAMLLSGVASFGIGYASSWCIRTTNSTTYSMVGALNKLPIAVFAMFYFGDKMTVGGALAVLLGFLAGLIYTQAKIRQQQASASELPAPVTMETKYTAVPGKHE
ncbi:GDP-mannose transporter [Thamnocephalis sphaerospora]|uniref:GDP-mannose transporter n=1 Tax=Thamnocephalis sphaerospora TaxID=78915 RepID=A0A4P9XL18_9FUNG|nr:GDP-mannose transporter [Thamnocephalis sphaerospora]|eukprot:RKP06466.1 GDP-mannose transporter [Thamnocephalis sphaerospora]